MADVVSETGAPVNIYHAKRKVKAYLADRPDVTGVGIGDNKIRVYLLKEEIKAYG